MEVTCPGCSNAFSRQGGCAPKLLECGHSFCMACLKLMAGADMRLVRCTTCRKSSVIHAGIEGLPFNFALLEVLPTIEKGNKTKTDKEKGGDTGESPADAYLKVVAVGESNVGKSWLSQKYLLGKVKNTSPTISDIIIARKKVDNKDIEIHLWDTAGQERFRSLVRTYFRGADGVLLVYSVADRESFQKIDQWMEEVQENTQHEPAFILVGSQADAKREVSTEQGRAKANRMGIPFTETSALTGIGVEGAFTALLQEILRRPPVPRVFPPSTTTMKQRKTIPKKKCCA